MTKLQKQQAKWKAKEEAEKREQQRYLDNTHLRPILLHLQSQGCKFRFVNKGWEYEFDLQHDGLGYWGVGRSPEEALAHVFIKPFGLRELLPAELLEQAERLKHYSRTF